MMLPARLRHNVLLRQVQDRVPGRCWVWGGSQHTKGYGLIHLRKGETGTRLAHRLSYEAMVSPIPDGLQIDHRCLVPSCIRPDHLEPVTNLENSLRSRRATKTHCIRNHPLSGENLIIKKPGDRGRRQCRTCHLMKVAEAAERRRQRREAEQAAKTARIKAILKGRAA